MHPQMIVPNRQEKSSEHLRRGGNQYLARHQAEAFCGLRINAHRQSRPLRLARDGVHGPADGHAHQ
jgi:hypothetical protein